MGAWAEFVTAGGGVPALLAQDRHLALKRSNPFFLRAYVSPPRRSMLTFLQKSFSSTQYSARRDPQLTLQFTDAPPARRQRTHSLQLEVARVLLPALCHICSSDPMVWCPITLV